MTNRPGEVPGETPGERPRVHVRPVRPGDGEGRARAWLDAARHYAQLDPASFRVPAEAGLADWFEQMSTPEDPDVLSLSATLGGQLAGFAVAEFQPPAPDPDRQMVRAVARPHVYVSALAVAERYRRAGVGTALMTVVERWARSRGAALVSLDASLHSPLATPFYEHRMGYARQSVTFRKTLPEA